MEIWKIPRSKFWKISFESLSLNFPKEDIEGKFYNLVCNLLTQNIYCLELGEDALCEDIKNNTPDNDMCPGKDCNIC